MKQTLKHATLVLGGFILAAGSMVFAATWQGTTTIQDGQIISADTIRDNFTYLYDRSWDFLSDDDGNPTHVTNNISIAAPEYCDENGENCVTAQSLVENITGGGGDRTFGILAPAREDIDFTMSSTGSGGRMSREEYTVEYSIIGSGEYVVMPTQRGDFHTGDAIDRDDFDVLEYMDSNDSIVYKFKPAHGRYGDPSGRFITYTPNTAFTDDFILTNNASQSGAGGCHFMNNGDDDEGGDSTYECIEIFRVYR